MYKVFLFIVGISCIWSCSEPSKAKEQDAPLEVIPQTLHVSSFSGSGVVSVQKQELTPDSIGIISEIKLELPKYKKGIYYRPFSQKLAAGNRVEPLWFDDISELDGYKHQKPRMDSHIDLGAFMMLQKENGDYLALLPLVSNRLGNTFSIRNKTVYLTVTTYGTDTENVAAPLMGYGQSKNPYEAARMAWEQAMNTDNVKENINWRSDKEYPEAYNYLGWCSWEHYKHNINEEVILDALKGMKESTIPFRWMLVDDGYLDHEKGQLLSFGADKTKFPNGWEPITSQKDDKIKWMGIWRNFNGYFGAVSPKHNMPGLGEHLVARNPSGQKPLLVPKISGEAANAFFHEMTKNTKANGFDIIKVDFQSDNFRNNAGASNAILGVHYNNIALEENCKDKDLMLLNCIAQQNFNVFNHRHSAIIRGSVDYKTTKDRLDVTLVQNFANAFWLGHTHWLDQDMFFANFEETAQLMAVARAMSGGPIYLSDVPEHIDDTVLKPLTYADGRILGTLAPAVPLPESLMQDPYFDGKAFRVIAPLKNKTAAIMAVNLNQDDKELITQVSLKDYPFAGGMIQPYDGLWEIPKEGILLYDYYTGSAQILKEDYQFTLGSGKERLLLLNPIQHGWSIIGRPDKYLSGSTFEVLEIDENSVKIQMVEDGPLLLWSDNKIPHSENFEFTKLENGLWKGELIKPDSDRKYNIIGKVQ
ncbi:Sip1-related alpha-galactosidase [Maribacter polysaccharolyticus]|uniref:Sip1-related alpha-galactosidase n=1 Tax=Maribacter polysaccharolyticus TaxID=3020831 RepID=UPI00237EFB15|nr:Sip1-related alpha-galactosidase [Maribacter polysaccharolyticus]MDE3742682.1 Sip1-related alpha-galactosidase [Maribacter polysaccharolyticus]